ncbi:U exon [Turkey adenovirus 1]|uniref:U exon n=1 Tax=Turkey adenovirus 1 TaxID=878329 RepID=E0YC75_9ADEN|nr:U exon [Turkey adenovirus 1]ADM53808.1 U exon [Turkey adenovirus 1]
MEEPRKYWLKVNEQAVVRFAEALNPGFVFELRRRFRCRVQSDGGARVLITRREPFSERELDELYCELEYRQQKVGERERACVRACVRGGKKRRQRLRLPVPELVFEGVAPLVEGAELRGEDAGVGAVEGVRDDGRHEGGHEGPAAKDAGLANRAAGALRAQLVLDDVGGGLGLLVGRAVPRQFGAAPSGRSGRGGDAAIRVVSAARELNPTFGQPARQLGASFRAAGAEQAARQLDALHPARVERVKGAAGRTRVDRVGGDDVALVGVGVGLLVGLRFETRGQASRDGRVQSAPPYLLDR